MATINNKLIKLSKAAIDQYEINAVNKVLKNEYLGMGEQVKKFENLLSNYFNSYVTCVSSGTSAIQLALQAHGIKKKDEVIVPSVTYVATFQAISATGAIPIACDVTSDKMLINTEDLEKRISTKTKAIIPVHYAGDPCDLKKLRKISKKYNLALIEDSAHAFGSKYEGKMLGSHKGTSCFSFDGIKNITSGEGGCVVTSYKKVDEYIKNSRNLGVIKDYEYRYNHKRKWDFDVKYQGWRYHMSDIMAAIGIEQFKKKEKFFSKRKKLALNYNKLLKKYDEIKFFDRDYNQIVPHIYPIRINNFKKIKNLQEKLLKKGIQTGIHYLPNHKLSFYKSIRNKKPLKITNKIFNEIITLPLHYDISFKQQEIVIKSLISSLNEFY